MNIHYDLKVSNLPKIKYKPNFLPNEVCLDDQYSSSDSSSVLYIISLLNSISIVFFHYIISRYYYHVMICITTLIYLLCQRQLKIRLERREIGFMPCMKRE